jgi:hypothetical protein
VVLYVVIVLVGRHSLSAAEAVAVRWRGHNALVFDKTDFDTLFKFINYAEMEPGSSICNYRLKWFIFGVDKNR